MRREDLLRSPEYWQTQLQLQLYNEVNNYLERNNMTKSEFAKKLGVSKGYVTQLLNGDFDHRMSKYVELLLAVGVVPQINLVDIDKAVQKDMLPVSASPLRFQTERHSTPIKTSALMCSIRKTDKAPLILSIVA